ncbi:MAG: EAL domain-containing protein [Sedimenticola sp.]
MNGGEVKILVVDDNEINRHLLVKQLSRKGFSATSAQDGEEALECVRRESPDLILLDIMMPEVDGMELLRIIRRDFPATELPVIMVTAKPESEQIGEALEQGANDYVTKPVDIKVLQARINTQIQLKRSVEYLLSLSEQLTRDSIKRLEAIYNTASDSIVTITEDGLVESFNHAAEQAFGYCAEEVIGKDMTILVPLPHRTAHYRYLKNKDYTGRTQIVGRTREICGRRNDGDIFPIEICINEIDVAGQILYSCVIRDLSERKSNERKIYNLAYVDTLTGLDNRNRYLLRCDQAISEVQKTGARLAVMLLDIDGFKEVNDNFGHPVGDQVLHEIGTRLDGCMRQEDIVARIGGDEFAILSRLPDAGLVSIETLLRKITAAIESPINIEGYTHYIQASIGISYYPDDSISMDELRRKADIALYKAKGTSGSSYRFYETDMDEEAWNRKKLVDALRSAVHEGGQLHLNFQPQIDLRDNSCHSVEALLRWHSPEFGVVFPGRFIPLAEESGLIIPIGNWVLREGFSQAKRWAERGLDVRIAINVSAIQFAQPDFVATVRDILHDTAVDPGLVELEITEGMVMEDISAVCAKLDEIRSLGVGIAIDDFGTGYSSLAYLKRLPVDCLKIDRSFILNIPGSEEDVIIIKAVISLARALGIRVVAEGVDRQEQVDFLRDANCEYIQGFLYSRPLSLDNFTPWLEGYRRLQSSICGKIIGV